MSEILNYINEVHVELLLIFGMLLVLRTDIYYDKRMIRSLKTLFLLILLFSAERFLEAWFGQQTEYSIWRSVLTVMNYALPPLILVRIILLFFRLDVRILYLPAVANLVLCSVSVFVGVVFSFDETNHFHRGPLGYVPFIIDVLYLVYIVYLLICSGLAAEREERAVIGFFALTGIFIILLPLYFSIDMEKWIAEVLTVDVVLYYIFILHQVAKRDTLTKMLNRQSYYADLDKFEDRISAMILVDMNGLKEINDKEGHIAGDEALCVIADCMFRTVSGGQRAYRIGGDEYVILCMRQEEEKVKETVEKLRTALGKTPYSCAIGYAMAAPGREADALYIEADKMMYQDKNEYYETHERYR